MFSLTERHRYFLYRSATDMRKGFDGLSGVVRNDLGMDPLSGDVFIFLNRRRTHMKLLVWEDSGFVVYYKRLERGRFEWDCSRKCVSRSDAATQRLIFNTLRAPKIILTHLFEQSRFSD